jgi:hypothetical protein
MLHGLTMLLVSGAALVGAQVPQTPASSALAELSARFVCPEALPDDDARQRALSDFFASYEKAYPSGAAFGAHAYRHVLLKTHGCKEPPPSRVIIFNGSNGAPFVFSR